MILRFLEHHSILQFHTDQEPGLALEPFAPGQHVRHPLEATMPGPA
jgi:hypothetical protein